MLSLAASLPEAAGAVLAITRQPTNVVTQPGTGALLSVEASGTTPLHFQWYFMNGGTSSGVPVGPDNRLFYLANAQPTDAGGYRVVVQDSSGSVTSMIAQLIVQAPPVILTQPFNVTVPVGGNAVFQVVAAGTPPLFFQWQFQNQNISGQTGPTLLIANVGTPNVGTYRVVVSNAFGPVVSTQATLGLIFPPYIIQNLTNSTVLQGGTVTLKVVAGGTAPLNFQWFRNQQPISGASGDTLVLENIQATQEGAYMAAVSNPAGTIQSESAYVDVLEFPFIISTPQAATVTCGGDAQFSVEAGGTPPLAYQWFFNGNRLLYATNATLFVPHADMAKAGSYKATISNSFGDITTQPAQLSVLCPPGISAQPMSQSVPAGQTAIFTVGASGSSPLFYQWRFNDTALINETNATLVLANVGTTHAGLYSVTVSNSFGSLLSSNASLTVTPPLPVIQTQPTNQTAPLGAVVVFAVKATGTGPLEFQWFFNTTPIAGATNPVLVLPPVTSTLAGTYRVQVSNSSGSVWSDAATLQVFSNELPFANHFADRVTTYWPDNHLWGHGSTSLATRELFEPCHDGKRGYHSVWLSWVAPQDGIVTLNTVGSECDTLLAVYTGQSLTSLVSVAADDDDDASSSPPNPYGWSRVQFNATQGTVYQIVVDSADWRHPNIVLECDFQPTNARVPCFSQQPLNRTLKLGDPVCLDFVPCDATSLSIGWFFNDTTLNVANGTSHCLTAAAFSQAGLYQVELNNTVGVTRSPRFEIQFNSLGLSNVMARDKFLDAPDFMQTAAAGTGGQSFRMAAPSKKSMGGGTGTRGFTTTQIFSTAGSTPEAGEPAHCGFGPFHSRWFTYQAPANGTMHISTMGSTFDTVLAVFVGPGDDFATLTNVACNNNAAATSLWSEVTFPATANTIYYIAVDGTSGSAVGTVNLTINLGDPVSIVTPPSSLVVLAGTNVTFTVEVSGMSNFTYRWRCNGTNLLTISNTAVASSSLTLTNVQPIHAGLYDVVVSNPITNLTSSGATLTVTNLRVTGQVALGQFTGPARDGCGTRTVTFKATDNAGSVLATWNLSLTFAPDTNGYGVASYTITNMPVATFQLSAKTAWHLRARRPVTFVNYSAEAKFTGTNELAGGDVNGSNTVDMADYVQLAAVWFLPNAATDVDGSGRVDTLDYHIMANSWLRAGDPE